MTNMVVQAQLGLSARTVRNIGTKARNLQQRRVIRHVSRRFLRVALATAEADVPAAEEVPADTPAAEIPAAPEGQRQNRQQRRGGGGRRQFQRPTIGPQRTMALTDLETSKTYEGAVVSVTDFGAFVNVGCNTDGLLHISQISTSFVKNVADAVAIGQVLNVRVLNIDLDRQKFSLTAIPEGEEAPPRGERASRSFDDEPSNSRYDNAGPRGDRPRQARAQKQRQSREPVPVAIGDVITGKISSIAPFGLFVEVGNGYAGMLHSSQMKLPEGVADHLGHYKEGDEVEVRVANISSVRGQSKISLTQKSEAELAVEEETRTRGLSAGVDVPEGSGPLAFMMAQAGISSDMFNSREPEPTPVEEEEPKPAAAEPKVEAKENSAPVAAEPKLEAKENGAPAAASGISAALVKELREASGAGMMDCKKALAECGGDIEVAKDFLRKKGLASADKKAGRVAAEGAVWSYIHAGSRLGVLVEVNCETDFVGRGEKFQELVNDIAMQIAACPTVTVVSTDEVSQEALERERAIEMEKEDIKSKPEAMREKIVAGRVDKIAKEMALLEQPFIKDTSKTVAEVVKEAVATIGENIQIRRFARFNLGEGIEGTDKGDFAAEVEAQTSAMAAKAAEKKVEPKEEAKEESKPAVQVSAALVKELREASGAGMMDCKKALAECGGDIEVAKDFLRKKGLASADKKAGRVAGEGAIGSYIHAGSRLGVLVEVNCETDFVARGEKFKELVNDIAMQIAACSDVRFVAATDVPAEVLERERAIEMEKEDLKSKPEAIREKIVAGRVDKIGKEMALLEQVFIKDTSKTVAEHIKEQIASIGENIQVRRFVRFNLGEGVEKKVSDFAAEVAAQTGGKL